MDVGTADVDFQEPDLVFLVEFLAGHHIVFDREAGDVRDGRFVEHLRKLREFLRDDFVDAGVLQAHRVDEALGAFGDARCGVSEPRFAGRALQGDAAEAVDVVKLCKLVAEAEGAACGDDRIVQFETGQGHVRVHHKTSSLISTGPSLQTLLFPFFVFMEQPIQAPNPQPIRSSKLYWPDVLATDSIALNIGRGPQV